MANDTTLFVVFHGSWAFLHTYLADPDQIIVRPPDMGEEHVYRCGSWLAEHPILRGSLHRLVQVTGNPDHTKKFDETVNFVTANSKLGSVGPNGPYTSFLFPSPLAIHSLAQLKIPAGNLTLDGQPLPNDVITSLVQVFEYSYDSTQPAQIEAFSWSPIRIPDATLGSNVATLHMFAEHEDAATDAHRVAAFEDNYVLLGHSVTLNPAGIVPVDPAQQRPIPPLLRPRCFELEPISTRTDRMAEVGRLKGTLDAAGNSADLRAAWPTKTSGCLEGFFPGFAAPRIGGIMPRTTDTSCAPGQGNCP